MQEKFRRAVEIGDIGTVKSLLNHPDANPAGRDNFAIQIAAQKGYVKIAKLLLTIPRVNPAAMNNFAIRAAAQNGHIEMVKLLLADERTDPTADNNYAIRAAAKKGHIVIVNLLLEDPRVYPYKNLRDIIIREKLEKNPNNSIEETIRTKFYFFYTMPPELKRQDISKNVLDHAESAKPYSPSKL